MGNNYSNDEIFSDFYSKLLIVNVLVKARILKAQIFNPFAIKKKE